MRNGIPFYLLKQRCNRDGHVGKHKERERKHIENPFPFRTVNVLPLRNRCQKPDRKNGQVEIANRHQQR